MSRFILITVLTYLSAWASGPPLATDRLVGALLTLVQNATDNDQAQKLSHAAIDAGPAAVGPLRRFVNSAHQPQRVAALVALAYIGGDDAVDALQRQSRDPETKALLCSALSSRGNAADQRFLIRALRGNHFGDEWSPIVSAALSLGLLRTNEAREALKATALNQKSIAGQAARDALRWLEQGRWNVELPTGVSESEEIVGAALANGIPRTNEGKRFFDRDRNGVWVQENSKWSFQRADSKEDIPSITLKVHMSPDSARALLAVGIHFEPMNAAGYDYVLRKTSGKWTIQSIFFTWIS